MKFEPAIFPIWLRRHLESMGGTDYRRLVAVVPDGTMHVMIGREPWNQPADNKLGYHLSISIETRERTRERQATQEECDSALTLVPVKMREDNSGREDIMVRHFWETL